MSPLRWRRGGKGHIQGRDQCKARSQPMRNAGYKGLRTAEMQPMRVSLPVCSLIQTNVSTPDAWQLTPPTERGLKMCATCCTAVLGPQQMQYKPTCTCNSHPCQLPIGRHTCLGAIRFAQAVTKSGEPRCIQAAHVGMQACSARCIKRANVPPL